MPIFEVVVSDKSTWRMEVNTSNESAARVAAASYAHYGTQDKCIQRIKLIRKEVESEVVSQLAEEKWQIHMPVKALLGYETRVVHK